MKIWFKIWENTHLLKSETIEDDTEDTRTHKIFHALEEVCLKWDLGKPGTGAGPARGGRRMGR